MKNNNLNITDALLMAYLLGEANERLINEVEDWLNDSEENVNYLDELERVWLETGDLNPKPVVVDIEKAWHNIENKVFNKEISLPESRKLSVNFYRIAAVILVLIGIFGLYKIFDKDTIIQTLASNNLQITDTLSDGSIISLNKNSKLSFPEEFADENRSVILEGEAFFEIAHNPKQPFIIDADGEGFIQVVGTKFNVNTNSKNGDIEVFVEEGKVKLFNVSENTTDTFSLFLVAGEKGIISKSTGKPEKLEKSDENKNDLYWKTKTLNFNKTNLTDAAKTLESIFDVKIELSENTKNLPLTATFEGDSIDRILEVIKITFNLNITKNNQTYKIDVIEN